jgi:ATP phosphoribosyltransferase
LRNATDSLRIVSEYPNLAESFALKQRLRRFRIFPLWGAAESFPPENAELAILAETSADGLREKGLVPVATILESGACLIANRDSLERKDFGRILSSLSGVQVEDSGVEEPGDVRPETAGQASGTHESRIFLALPDGHQQPHTIGLLNRAGLTVEGYNTASTWRSPAGIGSLITLFASR